MTEKREREIRIRISEDLYRSLEERARKEGFTTVSDYLSAIIQNLIKEKPPIEEAADKIRTKLERFIQDELNKRLSMLENLKKQISELYEKIEELDHRINNIESSMKERPSIQQKPESPRKTAMERLHEEKLVFESRLPSRIQRDRIFSYFDRMGAIVIKLSKERIAVDPDFWNQFKYKLLNQVDSNSEELVLNTLGEKGYELWKALYSDNAIIYDPKSKKWRFIIEVP